MKNFKDYFNDEEIIFYLCKLRAKIANQRNKKHLIHLLTNNPKYNYHSIDQGSQSDYEKQFQSDLRKLFPSRRIWKELNQNSRYKHSTKHKLTSIDKNVQSLIKTIKYYQKFNPSEEFLFELNNFIKDVQTSIENPGYFITAPIIYPKQKENRKGFKPGKGENTICRPITLFTLKDRLILSFTNKYLTQLFDCYFEDCSYAFRSVKKEEGGNRAITHHNAIQAIITYKNQYKEIPLWVAECDMKKFYDTVNHKIIKEHFERLINKAQTDNPGLNITEPVNIFYKYLDCYSFNKNVLPLNNDIHYWRRYKIEDGEFGWVDKEFNKLKYYANFENENIGIPQGGALSGLIANIVLDYADRKIIEKDLFYVRFCDDMILMHFDENKCNRKVHDYKKALEDLLLVPHDFCSISELTSKRNKFEKRLPQISLSPFWEVKSKGPYKWGEYSNDSFPWIGFVGYEIHYEGFIRVRKKSLKKELEKQKEVVKQISEAIATEKRVSRGTIAESAIHRLIGMSVGRVELWNYTNSGNEMCWKNGFQELNINKYSINQLKLLDRSRNKLYYKMLKDLVKLEESESKKKEDEEVELKKNKARQIIDYNKPFSYYYHVIEKLKEKIE